ncbi:MAG: 4Fe-4S dicluster domain-containing protein [Candidatus Lokiarchaeota archaeon]|nr:4Fe-4S dicluster domain-containing protein [Candidatus Lokiarchaeota archaeon]
MMIKINSEKCVNCGSCIRICPASIYSPDIENDRPKINDLKECLKCLACIISCKADAITINIFV